LIRYSRWVAAASAARHAGRVATAWVTAAHGSVITRVGAHAITSQRAAPPVSRSDSEPAKSPAMPNARTRSRPSASRNASRNKPLRTSPTAVAGAPLRRYGSPSASIRIRSCPATAATSASVNGVRRATWARHHASSAEVNARIGALYPTRT